MAASAQSYLENIVNDLISESINKYNISEACDLYFGGGVSLNCKLNHKISCGFADKFSAINIFPAGGDGGSSFGCCYHYLNEIKEVNPRDSRLVIMSGIKIKDAKGVCNKKSLKYRAFDAASVDIITSLLKKGAIGGIARDGAEFGPRALGNRSIIADPSNQMSLYNINKYIKNREDFRPLAPIILDGYAGKYFEIQDNSLKLCDNMLTLVQSNTAIKVKQNSSDIVELIKSPDQIFPSVVHLDGSSRLQIYKSNSPKDILYQILDAMPCKTLINTSMNVRGEPIVNTADEAIECFLNCKLDFLILQDLLILRDEQNELALMNTCKSNFEYD